MIALEEKITTLATLFVEKRDGRRVAFDVDKIDKGYPQGGRQGYGM